MALQVWLPLNGTLENKGLSNVTVTNHGATVDNNGKIGKCYKFNSNALYGDVSNINSMTAMSGTCWVNFNNISGAQYCFHIGGTGQHLAKLSLEWDNGSIRGHANGSLYNFGVTVSANVWYHLAITWNGNIVKLYVNGEEKSSLTTSGSISASNHLAIGSRTSNASGNSFLYPITSNGKLNDIRIYDHCLSAKEVKEISKGLILHYKLDGNDIGITIPRNGSLIPDGVELYEYLQSDGNAYIATDIPYDSTKSTYKVETKFSLPANVGLYDAIFGAYTDENSKTLRIIRGNNNSIMWSYYNTKAGGGICANITTSNSNVREVVLTSTETIVTENGTTTTYTHPAVNGNNTTSKFYLFCQGTTSGEIHCKSKSRIYYIRFYDNNILIGNFIPCTYLGEPGMWDTVENKFYRNQGTGLFTLGNKITLKEYEYLLNDANSYIDTGYIPNTHTHIKTSVLFSSLNDGDFFVYGSGISAGSNTFELYNWNNQLEFNYGHEFKFLLTPLLNTWLEIEHNKNQIRCDLTVDTMSTWTFSTPYTMYLFALHRANVIKSPKANKMKYFKIWDNNNLIRDYIPITYNGTPGLWDKVEWKFYANAGTGNFTLGPEKTIQQDAPIFYDSSGYCNHGSITGTLTTNNDSPRYTKSTVFNGSSAINAGHTAKVTDAITISYWAKTSTLGSVISCTQSGGFSSYPMGNWHVYANGGYGTIPYCLEWNDNNWHHIVSTFDGRYKKIYKDSVLEATQDLGAKYAIQYNTSAPIWIGAESQASNTPTTPYFNGSISDVRIYATALSEDDVKELYNTSAFVTDNGVFAEYELYEDNLSDVKKRGLLETANFYENGAESGYTLDTDKTRVASNYIISEDFIEI